MKIKEATTGLYRVPLRNPHADATHGHMNQVELVIVKLFTDVGIEASGYAYTIGRGGAAIKALIDQELMPLLLNEDPRYVESLWEKMWWQLHWVGRGGVATFAISAVDMALWDAIAKVAAQPLGAILGLHRDRVPVYGSGVDLNLTLDELLEEVGRFVERGFTAVKIKVGKDDPEEDLERVNAVRNFLDGARGRGRIALMVDANMRWDVPKAITMGREFEKLGVLWLEEPLIPDDVEGHAKVADALSMAVAAGENLHSKYEFKRYISTGALDIVQPDVVTLGGVTEWLKVAAIAEAWNLPVATHFADEIHVHLLCAIPNAMYLEHHAYRLDDYLINPLVLKDGYAIMPDVPGHGVYFDETKLTPIDGVK